LDAAPSKFQLYDIFAAGVTVALKLTASPGATVVADALALTVRAGPSNTSIVTGDPVGSWT
jgi:hypothetical protein